MCIRDSTEIHQTRPARVKKRLEKTGGRYVPTPSDRKHASILTMKPRWSNQCFYVILLDNERRQETGKTAQWPRLSTSKQAKQASKRASRASRASNHASKNKHTTQTAHKKHMLRTYTHTHITHAPGGRGCGGSKCAA